MLFHTESFTDKGLRAEINQDAMLIAQGDRISVFCVADGMGGHEHGEIASQAIVDEISDWHRSVEKEDAVSFMELLDSFEDRVSQINRTVFQKYNRNGVCGSTLVALLTFNQSFAIFSAGDSRIYRKRGLLFTQLTTDDVWQNKQDVKKDMDIDQIKSNRNYGKLTKAIGVSEKVTLNRITGNVNKGDLFFLCCDGVYKYVEPRELKKYVTKPEPLKKLILSSGAPDNYTFISVIFDS